MLTGFPDYELPTRSFRSLLELNVQWTYCTSTSHDWTGPTSPADWNWSEATWWLSADRQSWRGFRKLKIWKKQKLKRKMKEEIERTKRKWCALKWKVHHLKRNIKHYNKSMVLGWWKKDDILCVYGFSALGLFITIFIFYFFSSSLLDCCCSCWALDCVAL
jgi:hypothetical protein